MTTAKPKKTNPILFIVGLVFLCLCMGIFSSMNKGATQTAAPGAPATEVPASVTEAPTEVPTEAPAIPTETPIPSPTPDPNLVKAGTYMVNADIKPGIYRGEGGSNTFSSCYFARLKDLTGGLESVLANENAMGQFYVEILPTDYAIEVRCDLVPLSAIEKPAEFQKELQIGTYLVGRDIQPGTYKGKGGTDILTACYWARLKNLTGGLDAVIANENATNQYYVQVLKTDIALTTRCPLTFTGK